MHAVFNDTEHGRVLNDESSTCVYIAFGEAFSLMSLMGHLRFVNIPEEEEVFFICLDKHVSCPCLHDRSISKYIFSVLCRYR